MRVSEALQDLLKESGLEGLKEEQLRLFERYYQLIIATNEQMNLTSLTEPEDVAEKHFLDALLLSPYLKGKRVLDIGSGLGVPGIPLKIKHPELEVILMDALDKRVRYLNQTIKELELTEIQAIHGRCEDFAHEEIYRECFTTVTARAVAELPILVEYALPFVALGGQFIAPKGRAGEEELERAKTGIEILGGKVREVRSLRLPRGDERQFIIIDKIAPTPEKYPRKPHKIKKTPLI